MIIIDMLMMMLLILTFDMTIFLYHHQHHYCKYIFFMIFKFYYIFWSLHYYYTKYGDTALITASKKGHLDTVRTLLEYKSDVGAQNEVRNKNDDDMMSGIKVLFFWWRWLWLLLMMRLRWCYYDVDDRSLSIYEHHHSKILFFIVVYFHVSSLDYYYRMDSQLSSRPVWRVTIKLYVLFWRTVLLWMLRIR